MGRRTRLSSFDVLPCELGGGYLYLPFSSSSCCFLAGYLRNMELTTLKGDAIVGLKFSIVFKTSLEQLLSSLLITSPNIDMVLVAFGSSNLVPHSFKSAIARYVISLLSPCFLLDMRIDADYPHHLQGFPSREESIARFASPSILTNNNNSV